MKNKGLANIIEKLKQLKVIIPEKEPSKNKLSQNQIFCAGQMNMLMRVRDIYIKYDFKNNP